MPKHPNRHDGLDELPRRPRNITEAHLATAAADLAEVLEQLRHMKVAFGGAQENVLEFISFSIDSAARDASESVRKALSSSKDGGDVEVAISKATALERLILSSPWPALLRALGTSFQKISVAFGNHAMRRGKV